MNLFIYQIELWYIKKLLRQHNQYKDDAVVYQWKCLLQVACHTTVAYRRVPAMAASSRFHPTHLPTFINISTLQTNVFYLYLK